MKTLKFDLKEQGNKIKILNAVNNGPVHKRHANDQFRSNLEDFKAARIPYARNHDAAFNSGYGGEHSVDISAIFPNFDLDPYDPASYDFACTDEYILVTLEANTETFYRLGQKIEHYIKKFGTIPPKDFNKWAVICEHIIRHYNEGWANGFELNIQYWEIWNEPDLDPDDSTHKRTWGGTKAQFFDLYEIAAKHLKKCFPKLKIGGPAIAGRLDWAEDFLKEMQKRQVEIDFFSWHAYSATVEKMVKKGQDVKDLLVKYGYGDVESILNEWNYVRGWRDDFVYSIEQIIGMKGAAFTLAVMCASQHSPIDMLMYYDARPCAFNGLFDFYTLKALKGYYPFYWYGMMYDCIKEVPANLEIENIYSFTGVDKDGKTITLLSYYTDDDTCTEEKKFNIDFGKTGEYEIYLLDNEHDGELVSTVKELNIIMKPNTCLMIKEK